MVRFRPVTPLDEAALETLLYYAISVAPGEPPPPKDIVQLPELARYVEGWGTSAGDRGLLAEVDSVVAGGAWLRVWSGAERGYGFVDGETPELSMAVLAEYQGQGIGTELLRRVLEEGRLHHSRVSLSVAEHNRARRLYERAGFVAVGRDGDSITMLLQFGQPQTSEAG